MPLRRIAPRTTPVRARCNRGFTLVELLVVVVIVGILAAIAIPLITNQKAKANEAGAKSQVATVAKAVETLFTNDQAAGVLLSTPSSVHLSHTPNVTEKVATTASITWAVVGDRSGYCVSAWSDTAPSKYTAADPLVYDSSQGGILPTGTPCAFGAPLTGLAAVAGTPMATNTTPGTGVYAPLPAMQGRTVYVVFETVTLDGNFNALGGYGYTPTGNSGAGGMVVRNHGTGTSQYQYRGHTNSGNFSTLSDSSGIRTVGRHVGVVQVRDGIDRVYGGVGEGFIRQGPLVPGAGLNPTGSLTLAPISASDTPLASYLYPVSHDAETRSRVMAWLARQYGAPVPPGY